MTQQNKRLLNCSKCGPIHFATLRCPTCGSRHLYTSAFVPKEKK